MSKKITLVKPSTRTFFKESKKLGRYGPVEWLHGYVYGRWIYHYIGIGTGEHPIVKYLKPLGKAIISDFSGGNRTTATKAAASDLPTPIMARL